MITNIYAKKIGLCAFVLVLFIQFSTNTFACDCALELPVKEAVAAADMVFIGDVFYITNSYNDVVPYNRLVSFKVKKAFKFDKEKYDIPIINIETGRGGGDCGFGFEKDTQYLVYAYRNNTSKDDRAPALYTNICTRTAKMDDVTAEELAALGSANYIYSPVIYKKLQAYTYSASALLVLSIIMIPIMLVGMVRIYRKRD